MRFARALLAIPEATCRLHQLLFPHGAPDRRTGLISGTNMHMLAWLQLRRSSPALGCLAVDDRAVVLCKPASAVNVASERSLPDGAVMSVLGRVLKAPIRHAGLLLLVAVTLVIVFFIPPLKREEDHNDF